MVDANSRSSLLAMRSEDRTMVDSNLKSPFPAEGGRFPHGGSKLQVAGLS